MTRHTSLAALLAACLAPIVVAQPMPAPPVPEPARAPAFTARSVVFDAKAAAEERARQQPLYVESIVVEGRDPDSRRRPVRSLEQRFAETLLAPPPAAAVGMRGLDTTPCMSVPSSWNSLGNSYAPLAGCP